MKKPWYKLWWAWAMIVAIVVGVGYAIDVNNRKFTAASSPSSSATLAVAASSVTYSAGTYKVGSDIPAGEYFIRAFKGQAGSYEVLTENSHKAGNFDSFAILTVEDGSYLRVADSEMFLYKNLLEYYPNPQQVGVVDAVEKSYMSGTYEVGVTLPAGRYRLQSISGNGYTATLRDTKFGTDSITRSETFSNETYITVGEGQYLQVADAYLHQVNSVPSMPDEAAFGKAYGPGTYKVGSDIQAGEYFILNSSIIGSYKVSGDSVDPLAGTGFFETFAIVTVEDGNYLELTDCKMWPLKDVTGAFARLDGVGVMDYQSYLSGTYKVGVTLPAGKYKLQPTSGNGYMAILKDTKPCKDSILQSSSFQIDIYITVEDGQYLKVDGAYIINSY